MNSLLDYVVAWTGFAVGNRKERRQPGEARSHICSRTHSVMAFLPLDSCGGFQAQEEPLHFPVRRLHAGLCVNKPSTPTSKNAHSPSQAAPAILAIAVTAGTAYSVRPSRASARSSGFLGPAQSPVATLDPFSTLDPSRTCAFLVGPPLPVVRGGRCGPTSRVLRWGLRHTAIAGERGTTRRERANGPGI